MRDIVFKGSRLPRGYRDFLSPLLQLEDVESRRRSLDSPQSCASRCRTRFPTNTPRMEAGDGLSTKGEKVLPRHLAMLSAMKKALSDDRNLFHPFTILGSFVLSTFFTFVLLFISITVSQSTRLEPAAASSRVDSDFDPYFSQRRRALDSQFEDLACRADPLPSICPLWRYFGVPPAQPAACRFVVRLPRDPLPPDRHPRLRTAR